MDYFETKLDEGTNLELIAHKYIDYQRISIAMHHEKYYSLPELEREGFHPNKIQFKGRTVSTPDLKLIGPNGHIIWLECKEKLPTPESADGIFNIYQGTGYDDNDHDDYLYLMERTKYPIWILIRHPHWYFVISLEQLNQLKSYYHENIIIWRLKDLEPYKHQRV